MTASDALVEVALEERVACALASDADVLALADELDRDDFASVLARVVFYAVRNVQTTGAPVTFEAVAARVERDDATFDTGKAGRVNLVSLEGMLADRGGGFTSALDAMAAIRRLRTLRHRREMLLKLEASP